MTSEEAKLTIQKNTQKAIELLQQNALLMQMLLNEELFNTKMSSHHFRSKIQALEHVLDEAGEPLHASILAEQIRAFGFISDTLTVSGMLRAYDRQKRIFRAVGKNKFGLRKWNTESE